MVTVFLRPNEFHKCETSDEVKAIAGCRDCKGFHQLFIYGKLDREFNAYAALAGIKVVPV